MSSMQDAKRSGFLGKCAQVDQDWAAKLFWRCHAWCKAFDEYFRRDEQGKPAPMLLPLKQTGFRAEVPATQLVCEAAAQEGTGLKEAVVEATSGATPANEKDSVNKVTPEGTVGQAVAPSDLLQPLLDAIGGEGEITVLLQMIHKASSRPEFKKKVEAADMA